MMLAIREFLVAFSGSLAASIVTKVTITATFGLLATWLLRGNRAAVPFGRPSLVRARNDSYPADTRRHGPRNIEPNNTLTCEPLYCFGDSEWLFGLVERATQKTSEDVRA